MKSIRSKGRFFTCILLIVMTMAFDRSEGPMLYEFPEMKFFPPMPHTYNSPTFEGAELGRFLFYDPVLSADSTVSCASCHDQRSAFTDSPNRFSKGISGAKMKRNTPPLFNLAWNSAFFWDGRAASIEDQVLHAVRAHDEMNLNWNEAAERISLSEFYRSKFSQVFGDLKIDSILIARAIGQFERTLISSNSKYDRVLRGEDYFTHEEYEGFVILNDQSKGDCLHCHVTDANALGTTGGFSNNGIENASEPSDFPDPGKGAITGNESELGWFKIPSLRNIAVTAPYMHDGRFETLEEVLDFYSVGVHQSINIDPKMQFAHQGGVKLNEDEKRYVIAFLKTLTDSTFIMNPEFGNPFQR
ncbi:MAG: hypothetical protein KDC05_14975 [Bacteroidales bacterium]|nr:hypothetical protein [Bacteroidales bacterium]